MAALGLKPEDVEQEPVGVYPENWESFVLFDAMGTQWRAGACGATGLDYNALPVVIRSLGLAPSRRPQLFQDIRVMEAEALAVMAEARDLQ